jgi:hypothetical protein
MKGKTIGDDEIHDIVEKFKVDVHALESFIYTEFAKIAEENETQMMCEMFTKRANIKKQ